MGKKSESEWIQGVYVRLNTLDELDDEQTYKCHILVAVPHSKKGSSEWARKHDEIERGIESFWNQFTPRIECVGVEVLGTEDISLADIEPYQRFDADWVSFSDDTPVIPPTADMDL